MGSLFMWNSSSKLNQEGMLTNMRQVQSWGGQKKAGGKSKVKERMEMRVASTLREVQ